MRLSDEEIRETEDYKRLQVLLNNAGIFWFEYWFKYWFFMWILFTIICFLLWYWIGILINLIK